MDEDLKSQQEKAARDQRFREGLKLHEIENNPLDAEDIAMFEMFEREGWSHEKRRAYIRAQIVQESEATLAAE